MELILLALSLVIVAMSVVIVLLLRARGRKQIIVGPDYSDPDGPPTLGEHIYPRVDEFDGLWETWICRHCGIHHKRKREGL